ncbi:MAG: acyl-ACP--UDP-N-acetylglucosamine O-acyltransferase [Gemmatimonadetes bacterium]|jgi:UDP-N-acetylglucosamine acyltransferase|nr:acyl-ACP--UDP-N-acetylglucosamine O-acyltransferase [Gemmatimonadota bacterium]
MTARIHPTAIVDDGAVLGADVQVGPGAIIGPRCTVGDGCVIAAHAVLEENVRLGQEVKIGIGTVLGSLPQDLKFKGEETWVEVGDRTTIREYSTINRATAQSYRTTVGKDCFLMSYVHVAHDCHIGDGVIISNATQLAGHVTIEERAIISGVLAVHQFARIGRFSFIGGMSRVNKDVPPYVKAVGNPIKLYGLNSIGLQRNGFSPEVIMELKKAYRLFFRSELNITQALEQARRDLAMSPEVQSFVDFVEASQRGIVI